MFFYVSLFIACVISAFLGLYLYHALVDVGKVAFKSLLPGSKDNIAGHLGTVRSGSTAKGTQTPWGWRGNDSDNNTRTRRPGYAAPNGASGLDGFLNNVGNKTTSTGWPYREDKVEPNGKAYKVTRKTVSSKPRLRTGGAQPWGW